MTTKRLRGLLTHFGTRSPMKETDSPMSASAAVSDPELPTYDKLPMFKNLPGCAWSVWGEDDQLGTVNLLTEKMVQRAAREEILTGHAISLNWPLNFPEKPVFKRKTPEVRTTLRGVSSVVRDDEIHINTQSGTQWDGLRHYGVVEHGVYYNNTPGHSLSVGVAPIPNPHAIDASEAKLGMQNWADHGICGRGVLLDLVHHQTKGGTVPLQYDPWATHAITVADLEACAAAQGVSFRQADILLLRVGFIQKYYTVSQEERDALPGRPETFAGIEQSEDMKRFLWDNHFAAIASDQPSLERWPTPQGVPHMHQTLLGLWGMPIGEFFDLEKLAVKCAETGRYTFFFSSWPLNIIGGCASPPNAAAYF